MYILWKKKEHFKELLNVEILRVKYNQPVSRANASALLCCANCIIWALA